MPNNFNLTESNPWLGWLDENNQATYNAFLPQSRSRNFADYYKGQYGNIYNDYMTQLGKMALGGQAPSQNFSDYLGNYNFQNNWKSLSPWSRGVQNSARVNWNV
jgi:hypothetical protein